MKRPFIALVMSLSLLVTACQRELDCPEDPHGDGVTVVSLSLPDGGITRTYLGEQVENTFPLLWAEGDKVSLNGTESAPVSAEEAGGKACTFTFRGSVKAPFNILYPATAESDKVTFPQLQSYRPGSFDPASFPMYASCGSYSDAQMHHLGTLLGFPFTAPEGEAVALKQLVVMSIDGKTLSGTFTLQKGENDEFTGSFAGSQGVTTATLEFPDEGLTLGNEPVTAWISLPAGEYPKGFTALVIDTEEKAMMMNFMTKEDSSDSLQPGTAILFPSTCFNPGDGIFIVDEPEDLIRLSSEPTGHPEVLMVRSINMSEVENWTPIEGFDGLFNGAGHTVSGLNSAIFGSLTGEVRNLAVDADIEAKEIYLSALAKTITETGKVSSCSVKGRIAVTGTQTGSVYMGGIAAINKGEITSSTVEAELCIPADASTGPAYIGAITGYSTGTLTKLTADSSIECAGTIGNSFCGQIAGYLKSSSGFSLNSCSTGENASLSLTYPATGTPTLRFGGLFGYITSPETVIADCTNRTSIDVTVPEGVTQSNLWIGGIVGNVNYEGDGKAHFDSCVNHGDITLTGKGKIGANESVKRVSCMAGIVGKCMVQNSEANSTSVIFEECINNGDIILNSLDQTKYGQITYLAGICADVNAADISDLRCENNGDISISGYTDRCCMGGHIGIVWPDVGSKTTLTITGKGNEPVNTGTLAYRDRDNQKYMKHPVAGGVIGLIMGQEVPVEFTVKDCLNSGKIDRTSPISSEAFVINVNQEASAGGIVGNIGFQSSTTKYTKVNGVIENCSNTAQITINAFTREDATFHDHHIEKTASQSFLGGILGFSHAKSGLVTVRNCSNSGYMRLTAGNAGGIVGRIQSNTIVTGTKSGGNVTYTTNTGRVGEFGLDIAATYISTGYAYSGGIVGAMIHTDASDVSKIEYCHNAGDVAGSHVLNEDTGKGTARPTAGGIIGQYDFGRNYAAVRWCKNSGHTRCYRSFNGQSTYFYSGLISGSAMCNLIDDADAPELLLALVRDCAVGGQCLRSGGWTAPTAVEGEYPFHNYIYCYVNLEGDYPPTTEDGTGYAEGCEWWDGVSKTSWEE